MRDYIGLGKWQKNNTPVLQLDNLCCTAANAVLCFVLKSTVPVDLSLLNVCSLHSWSFCWEGVVERCACENRAQSPDKTAIVCKKEEVKKKGVFPPCFTFSIHSTNRSALS